MPAAPAIVTVTPRNYHNPFIAGQHINSMNTGKILTSLLWFTPIVGYSADAQAQELLTHVYFAHSLLWAMPLLDPALQQAISRFPQLLMAGGACQTSPSYHRALTTALLGSRPANAAHASDDEETTIAIGYASYIYIEVIANKHFVPAHEAIWMEGRMIHTHRRGMVLRLTLMHKTLSSTQIHSRQFVSRRLFMDANSHSLMTKPCHYAEFMTTAALRVANKTQQSGPG